MHDIREFDQLKIRAEQIGLSTQELADRAGLHRTSIEKAFAGKVSPTFGTVKKITTAIVGRENELRMLLGQGMLLCPHCGEPLQQEMEAVA